MPPASLGQPAHPDLSGAPGVHSSAVESVIPSASDAVLELASPCEQVALPLEGLLLDEPTLIRSRILPYAGMVASVIEGRGVSRDELLAALRKRMRQHRIARQGRREYVVCYLNQHPP